MGLLPHSGLTSDRAMSQRFDVSKSLDELEPLPWEEPDFDSYLVTTCYGLKNVLRIDGEWWRREPHWKERVVRPLDALRPAPKELDEAVATFMNNPR